VYDVATNTSKTLVNNLPHPANYEGFVSVPVVWGEPGLAVLQSYVEMPNWGATVLVYNTDGLLVSTSPKMLYLANVVWMIDGAQVMLGMVTPVEGTTDGVQWQLYNPLGGAPFPMQGSPELFSVTAPDGLSFYSSTPNSVKTWSVANAPTLVATADDIGLNFLTNLAISPDGKSYAYVAGQAIYSDGPASFSTVVSGKKIQGVVWGPVRWRVKHP
jgi:hypothetical protein